MKNKLYRILIIIIIIIVLVIYFCKRNVENYYTNPEGQCGDFSKCIGQYMKNAGHSDEAPSGCTTNSNVQGVSDSGCIVPPGTTQVQSDACAGVVKNPYCWVSFPNVGTDSTTTSPPITQCFTGHFINPSTGIEEEMICGFDPTLSVVQNYQNCVEEKLTPFGRQRYVTRFMSPSDYTLFHNMGSTLTSNQVDCSPPPTTAPPTTTPPTTSPPPVTPQCYTGYTLKSETNECCKGECSTTDKWYCPSEYEPRAPTSWGEIGKNIPTIVNAKNDGVLIDGVPLSDSQTKIAQNGSWGCVKISPPTTPPPPVTPQCYTGYTLKSETNECCKGECSTTDKWYCPSEYEPRAPTSWGEIGKNIPTIVNAKNDGVLIDGVPLSDSQTKIAQNGSWGCVKIPSSTTSPPTTTPSPPEESPTFFTIKNDFSGKCIGDLCNKNNLFLWNYGTSPPPSVGEYGKLTYNTLNGENYCLSTMIQYETPIVTTGPGVFDVTGGDFAYKVGDIANFQQCENLGNLPDTNLWKISNTGGLTLLKNKATGDQKCLDKSLNMVNCNNQDFSQLWNFTPSFKISEEYPNGKWIASTPEQTSTSEATSSQENKALDILLPKPELPNDCSDFSNCMDSLIINNNKSVQEATTICSQLDSAPKGNCPLTGSAFVGRIETDCWLSDDSCGSSLTYDSKQRGGRCTTKSGKCCLPWNNKTNNQPSNDPIIKAKIDSTPNFKWENYIHNQSSQNNCLNPDNSKTNWCYYKNSNNETVRDYCDSFCPKNRKCTTLSGKSCIPWVNTNGTVTGQKINETLNYKDWSKYAGTSSCINPDNSKTNWCYTSNDESSKEYCDNDCPDNETCTTLSGKSCIPWVNISGTNTRNTMNNYFYEDQWVKDTSRFDWDKYKGTPSCINPDGKMTRWCYTSNQQHLSGNHNNVSGQWEYCLEPCPEGEKCESDSGISESGGGITQNKVACKPWMDVLGTVTKSDIDNNPNFNWNSYRGTSKCANPDGKKQNWCYTSLFQDNEGKSQWGYCDCNDSSQCKNQCPEGQYSCCVNGDCVCQTTPCSDDCTVIGCPHKDCKYWSNELQRNVNGYNCCDSDTKQCVCKKEPCDGLPCESSADCPMNCNNIVESNIGDITQFKKDNISEGTYNNCCVNGKCKCTTSSCQSCVKNDDCKTTIGSLCSPDSVPESGLEACQNYDQQSTVQKEQLNNMGITNSCPTSDGFDCKNISWVIDQDSPLKDNNTPNFVCRPPATSQQDCDNLFFNALNSNDARKNCWGADTVMLQYQATKGTTGVFEPACGYCKPIKSEGLDNKHCCVDGFCSCNNAGCPDPNLYKSIVNPVSDPEGKGNPDFTCPKCKTIIGSIVSIIILAVKAALSEENMTIEIFAQSVAEGVAKAFIKPQITNQIINALPNTFSSAIKETIANTVYFALFESSDPVEAVKYVTETVTSELCTPGVLGCFECTGFWKLCSKNDDCCSGKCSLLNGVWPDLACPVGHVDHGSYACCKTVYGTEDQGNCPLWSCGIK